MVLFCLLLDHDVGGEVVSLGRGNSQPKVEEKYCLSRSVSVCASWPDFFFRLKSPVLSYVLRVVVRVCTC